MTTQIPVTFSVATDAGGLTHVTAKSLLTGNQFERIGGRYLKQYSGRRHDMEMLASELQRNYDNARGSKTPRAAVIEKNQVHHASEPDQAADRQPVQGEALVEHAGNVA